MFGLETLSPPVPDRRKKYSLPLLFEYCVSSILLTSIDFEGSREGYDIALLKQVCESVSIPVIAFGGVGKWEHLVDGIRKGNADAVSAANIFHYTELSIKNAKKYLVESGLNFRKVE